MLPTTFARHGPRLLRASLTSESLGDSRMFIVKHLLLFLLGMLICSTCRSDETGIPSSADTRAIALRATAWLVHDDWGQTEKQYKSAGSAKYTANWRTRLFRQASNAIAVKVFHGDRTDASDQFIYNRASRRLSEPEPAAMPAKTISVRIRPSTDGDWEVWVAAGPLFQMRVVQQDETFVVRRYEATWIVD